MSKHLKAEGTTQKAEVRNILAPANFPVRGRASVPAFALRASAWSRRSLGVGGRSTLVPFALCLLPLLASASACRQDMHDAPRYDPLESSLVLPKGSSAQPLVA